MRLSRARASIVLLLALLHVATGVVSALALCCEKDAHAASETTMECCLKGGPHHMCPFMSKSARKKIPNGGRMSAGCASSDHLGLPVLGFAGVLQHDASIMMQKPSAGSFAAIADPAILRAIHPPTPPPKHLL
jgi:hypothetical protein